MKHSSFRNTSSQPPPGILLLSRYAESTTEETSYSPLTPQEPACIEKNSSFGDYSITKFFNLESSGNYVTPTLQDADVIINDIDLRPLNSIYGLIEDSIEHQFILSNGFLFSALVKIADQLFKYFPESTLRLSIFHDYDSNTTNDNLVINICTSLDIDTTLDKYDQLLDDWWIDHLSLFENKIIIAFDYK